MERSKTWVNLDAFLRETKKRRDLEAQIQEKNKQIEIAKAQIYELRNQLFEYKEIVKELIGWIK